MTKNDPPGNWSWQAPDGVVVKLAKPLPRKAPNMTEKLAAAYLSLIAFRNGKWCPVLDRIRCKELSAKEICALFEVDHYPITVFMGGSNHPTNLVPMLKADHRQKTYKIDALENAKMRRMEKKKAAAAKKAAKVDRGSGCVFKDLNTPCENPDCKVCPADGRKAELTERQKAYRKAIYEKRKLARKKPKGWGGKKW